ncbi:MAG: peptide chain release factor N(5)-glutamine methyltransferase [Oscillospiraceae bacterium]|nr:peptide chain release factor N(5)-glutamine methyltransferase [Oscillospiraceae bacterium]
MTRADARKTARQQLRGAGVDNAAAECDWLLCKALACSHTELLLSLADAVPSEACAALDGYIQRRCAGEPVQYILQEWDFCGLSFDVGAGVLIPRPETEILAETACKIAARMTHPLVVDLCAGTGCIGLTVAARVPQARVVLVEKSAAALTFLRTNAQRLTHGNATLLQGDILADSFPQIPHIDLLLSNPPYIPTGELPTLQREVQREPKLALDGGDDGLLFYRVLAEMWASRVLQDGQVLLELGDEQYPPVAALFAAQGYAVEGLADHAGQTRFLRGVRG